jgi:two-component system chemotaxis sensor kinase CheA
MVKNLLILEKGSNQVAIDEIFRSIHTLKGASASMGFADMERLCHAMEDIFQLIRSGSAEMSQDLGNLLLACSDMLEQMIDDVEGGGDSSSLNPDDQVRSLKEWLEKLGGGKTKEVKTATPAHHVPPSETEVLPASATVTNGSPEFTIRIVVSPECMMKDVRAMIAIGNLEALGTITMITPSKDDIDEGRFDGTVDLRISSDAGEEALRTAAHGSEIATVEIKQVEAVKQEKKPAEQDKKQASAAEKSREIKNLRVDIQALDHIMNLVEDLVINRGRLKQIAEQHRIKEMDEAIGMVDRSVSELQNLMMNIRMIPLNHIFNRLPRVVRDVAQYDSKEVEFVMEGGETELDRSVMDGLNDPLLHLIRNSVNHGIESPEAREAAGKPRKGFVKLAAHRDRDNVIIELVDDGGGINVEKVKSKAVERGLISAESAGSLTTDQAVDLLFQPGFSTADKISDISGRGVGLDVVKRSIEALKGTIRVETTPGKGSRFELLLPPTMAIVDVMIVIINGRRLGTPISSIV